MKFTNWPRTESYILSNRWKLWSTDSGVHSKHITLVASRWKDLAGWYIYVDLAYLGIWRNISSDDKRGRISRPFNWHPCHYYSKILPRDVQLDWHLEAQLIQEVAQSICLDVMRFVSNCLPEISKSTINSLSKLEPLTVPELHAAEMMWVRSCQDTTYRAEIANIECKSQCFT